MNNKNQPKVLLQVDKLAAYRVPIFNLLAKQVELDVVTYDQLGLIENVCFRWLKGSRLKIGPFNFSYFDKRISDYDVIISSFDGYNLNTYYYTLAYPHKTILYCLGYGRSLIAAVIRRYLHKRTAATLVYTQATAQQLIKSGVSGRKVFFTGNSVEVTTAKDSKRHTFLNIGTPKPHKRVEDLLIAINMIREKIPSHIRVVLVGPDVENVYRPIVDSYNLNSIVDFYPEIRAEEDIANLYSNAIAFVSGHVGLSAPQSLGYGVPVVARADVEQGPEFECVIDGFTGRTYRSCKELAQILLELLENGSNTNLLGLTGLALYKSSLSADAMCGRMMNAIQYVFDKNN